MVNLREDWLKCNQTGQRQYYYDVLSQVGSDPELWLRRSQPTDHGGAADKPECLNGIHK